MLDILLPLWKLTLFRFVKQLGSPIFPWHLVQYRKMASFIQFMAKNIFAHFVPGRRDINADKNNRNGLTGGIFYRLILCDVAFIK